ncbi:MAG TPA: thiolase family protein [Spirochaetota bacterium]|nr:thiolase family protein [Spirochaetota bacterium]HOD14736.1 thiolase family protein [Spirochaetota bacterium]HPG49887.1 thiolase family protein [Spirochaetota bacterium]HPN11518.1 thiolase family protein [Spirochaetota bacterium]
MAHRKKNRHVAIIGIGQTKFSSHREDVNQPEMIHEAVSLALKDAGLTMKDIECVIHGNMELFEMIHQPDLWHTLGTGAEGKDCIRITTGGTVGITLACASDNLVASGMYDIVMAIGFEKLQEGNTTGGITNMADPLWFRNLQTGALTGSKAYEFITEFGEDRSKRASLMYRVIMDKHAGLNPNAHRSFGLEFDQIDDLIKSSPKLIGDLKLIEMCSQSDGACCVIFACEKKAKELSKKPVWIRDHITVHREEIFQIFGYDDAYPVMQTHRFAAENLYKRNGITNPTDYFDVFEMYDPASWWAVDWLRDFFQLKGDEHIKLVEDKEIMIGGKIPVNPSGGVIASNPIGATALVRVAEAALQIRGDAGAHQIPKPVRHALASGFGGTLWTVLMMLEKELNW